jgi:hypothetical protein
VLLQSQNVPRCELGVITKLGLDELHTSLGARGQFVRAPLGRRVEGRVHPADNKVRAARQGAARVNRTLITHTLRERHDIAGFDIEYALRLRLVASAWIVAG